KPTGCLTAPVRETTIAERGKGRFPRQILRSEADMDKVDCVVVGAGVIGLAVARRLAQAGREVIVLEATEGIGTITSSRNSEVIHAGIYYRAGSLMAQMCVSGKRARYQYCRDHGIPHRNCGKLIVATTPSEAEKLQSIRAHAEANGVDDLQLREGGAARALEPALNCDAALLSPSTGIIDSHAYMLALRGDAEEAGAACAFHTPIERARAKAGRIEIEAGGDAPMTLECSLLVNAAGLGASAVARSLARLPREAVLSPNPPLLADAAGRRADAELFRDPAQDRAAGGRHAGLPDPGPARSRRRRTDQSVRHRVARTDVVAGDRGPCRRIGRTLSHGWASEPREPTGADERTGAPP